MGMQGINRGLSTQYQQIDKKVLGYKLNGEYKTTEFRILQKKDSFILRICRERRNAKDYV